MRHESALCALFAALANDLDAVVAALSPRYSDLLIVQIDAHADLRDSFDGTPWSHACAMRRVCKRDHVQIMAVHAAVRNQAEQMKAVTARTSESFL